MLLKDEMAVAGKTVKDLAALLGVPIYWARKMPEKSELWKLDEARKVQQAWFPLLTLEGLFYA